MTTNFKIPLFPLHSVLFPGGLLPLRVFEPRYLDMISDCLRNDNPFGVCLIKEGSEVGSAAITYKVGTIAKIIDWNQRTDGLLGVDVVGEQRFKILFQTVFPNQLIEAEVTLLPTDDPEQEIPSAYSALSDLLKQFIDQTEDPEKQEAFNYKSASWVSHRLAELLPMSIKQRQYLLELNDPIQRLDVLSKIIQSLNVRS